VSNYKLFKNVKLGNNIIIEEGVKIGVPPFGKKDGELETIIGDNAYIRSNTTIYAGVEIGSNFQTGPNVLIRENNKIGDNVVIWHGSTLNPENTIGKNSRVHAGCFLEMVTLGENVFLGPRVVFTDDPHPVIPINFRNCWGGAIVEDQVSVGGNATILPHVRIGKNAVIGAGSVVTKDVPPDKVVVGNPAHVIKEVLEIECIIHGRKHLPYLASKSKFQQKDRS